MENTGKVKVENCMYIATEEGPTGIKTEKMYMPSAFCVKKAEPEDCCDSLKAEHSLGTEAYPTSSYDNNQVTCVKVEPVTDAEQVGNPVQIINPAMKHEHQGTLREHEPIRSREHADSCDVCHVKFGLRSELESHHCVHVVEHKANSTSLRKSFAGTSGEKRKGPSDPDVEKWEEEEQEKKKKKKKIIRGMRGRIAVRRRKNSRWYDKNAIPLTACGGQHRRFRRNHDPTSIGHAEDTSPKNEEAIKGTECSAAGENTRQNCSEVEAPQEFKKPKSDSAVDLKSDYLKSKTERKEHDDADLHFFQSLIPDVKKLSDRRKLKFKQLIMSSLSDLLDEEGHEAHASQCPSQS